jgi:hypothetical protein
MNFQHFHDSTTEFDANNVESCPDSMKKEAEGV